MFYDFIIQLTKINKSLERFCEYVPKSVGKRRIVSKLIFRHESMTR